MNHLLIAMLARLALDHGFTECEVDLECRWFTLIVRLTPPGGRAHFYGPFSTLLSFAWFVAHYGREHHHTEGIDRNQKAAA
jgi:hypothetical protein